MAITPMWEPWSASGTRALSISAYAGKTINQFLVGNSSAASTGAWNAWYSDIAIVSADGTVTPIYTDQTSASFQFVSTSSPLATNLSALVTHDSTVGANTVLTTSYYHGDQIGSSRLMTAGTGWPIWQGTFLPFGEEYNPQISSNHYKFTGKERDAESGLDYFGARYYGSALGRFITSDWSTDPIPVPYADFDDPQSLNQYSYVRNVPTVKVDFDGHGCPPVCNLPTPTADDWQMIKVSVPLIVRATLADGPAAPLAAPSVIGMGVAVAAPRFEVEDCAGPYCDMFVPFVPTAQGQSQTQTQTQNGQAQETEHQPELQTSTNGTGARQGNGRSGKQARLKELGKDDKVSSVDRGQIKRDQNEIARGKRTNIRVPVGKELAHRRGKEARKGHGYQHSVLQSKDLHRLQHKHEGYK